MIIFRRNVAIGHVASAVARGENFLPDAVVFLEDKNVFPAEKFGQNYCGNKSGKTAAQNGDLVIFHFHLKISLRRPTPAANYTRIIPQSRFFSK